MIFFHLICSYLLRAGARVATVATGFDGVANAPVLDAGDVVGVVRVTALAAGGILPASFTLRVIAY
jgi:hypothetical protein